MLLSQKWSTPTATAECISKLQAKQLINRWFGRLTKIWDGIADCMISKQCSCGKYECDLNSAREKGTETLRVHDFLSGLDDATHGVIRMLINFCNLSASRPWQRLPNSFTKRDYTLDYNSWDASYGFLDSSTTFNKLQQTIYFKRWLATR